MTPDLLKELAEVLPWRYELTTRKDGHTRLWMTSGTAEGTLDTSWTDVENGSGCFLLLDLLESKGWTYSFSCEEEDDTRYVLQLWHKATSKYRLADGSGSTRTEAIARAVVEALKEKP